MSIVKIDKRHEKGEETLNRILLQAIEIIAAEGINGITASKLSAGSGVSKSTIFHHFKTTQEIPKLALAHIFNELMRPIETVDPDTLEEYLIFLGSSITAISNVHATIYRAFFSFYHESLFNGTYREIMGEYLKTTEKGIRHMISKYTPTLPEEKALIYVTMILSSLDGIGLHLLMGKDPDLYLKAWNLQAALIAESILQN